MLIYIAICLLLGYCIWKYLSSTNKNYPPGPTGFLRSLSSFNALTLSDHYKKYGEVSSFMNFGIRFVIFNGIDSLNEAYTMPKYAAVFSDRKKMFVAKHLLSNTFSFMSPSDKNWYKQRQLIQEAIVIRGKNADKIEVVTLSELRYLTDVLKEKCLKIVTPHGKNSSEEFDIKNIFTPSLINSVIILLVGERFEHNNEILDAVEGWLTNINILIHPFNDFVLSTIPFVRYLPFGLGKVLKKEQAYSAIIFKHLLEGSRTKLEKHGDSCEGIVYNILRQQRHATWITDDLVRGSIAEILGAANVTTRTVLYSFFLILINNKNVERKIQEEIDRVIQTREPTLNDKKEMPYTMAAIFELMRYATAAPLGLPNECSETVVFRGYTIPKHSILIKNLWGCHFSEHWEDPWKFKPERFLDVTGELVAANDPNRKNLLSFSLGKRHCIGEMFAYNRIFLYIVTILQMFSIFPGSNTPSADPQKFDFSSQNVGPFPYTLRIQLRHG